MKRSFTFVITVLLTVLFIISCGTSGGSSGAVKTTSDGRATSGGMPQFVRNAVRNAPPDVIVGVGSAKMANLHQSRTIAQTRARAEIARKMGSTVDDMVTDHFQGTEVDHSAVTGFSQNIIRSLARSQLVGTVVIEEDRDGEGNYWIVMTLGKNNVVREINQAVAEAKLAAPRMQSFEAEARMDAAFDKLYRQEVGFDSSSN